jgi:putative PIN family toxin of toxin-antitoxin system
VKVVLDTNVLLAAFATRGLCEAVMAVCLDRHEIYLSEHILNELARHLADKFKMPTARVAEIMEFLRDNTSIVIPVDVPIDACRDADDLPILGTMLSAGAECLVTGDADLSVLGSFQKMPIYSPRQYYDQFR